MTAVTLKAMFGDFPVTEAFKRGDFASPDYRLDLTDDYGVNLDRVKWVTFYAATVS